MAYLLGGHISNLNAMVVIFQNSAFFDIRRKRDQLLETTYAFLRVRYGKRPAY